MMSTTSSAHRRCIAIITTLASLFIFVAYNNITPIQDHPKSRSRALARVHAPSGNFKERSQLLSKPWPSWQSTHPDDHWCVNSNDANPDVPRGLIYVRIPKTGSTTVSGIVMRIARRHAIKKSRRKGHGNGTRCEHYWRHHPAAQAYVEKSRQSFLFGSVRDPTKRALSNVYFKYVTKWMNEPDDDFIIEKLKELSWPQETWNHVKTKLIRAKKRMAGFQMGYLFLRPSKYLFYDARMTYEDWEDETVRMILDDYDFLIVSERMNESLVALQFVLGLDVGDILYLSSNVSGKSYRYDYVNDVCRIVEKPVISPKVAEFLQSQEWQVRISGDVMLHEAANRCLDDTIESIGRDTFRKALDTFNRMLALAHETCAEDAVWICKDGIFDREKTKTDCELDLGVVGTGCGYRCLDELIATSSS